jgi:hypothetical protein
MTVSNGTWQGFLADVEPQGTLTIAGGSSFLNLYIGNWLSSATATVWMTGGQLITSSPNTNFVDIGVSGLGQFTMSNGTWQAYIVVVGDDSSGGFGLSGTGTLTLAGGTNVFSSLYLGGQSNCVGTAWLNGGSLTITNELVIGAVASSHGTLTVSGGQLVVTNGSRGIVVGGRGSVYYSIDSGRGRMSVVNGSAVAQVLQVAGDNSPFGELTVSGSGSLTVLAGLTIGNCDSNAFGVTVMTGGKLFVTNATHDAVLEVSNGFFLLTGGSAAVDKLIVTNGCYGGFDRSGGNLSIGQLTLDPNGDVDGDSLPNEWEQTYGLDPLSSVGDNGYDGDPDGDGYLNWEEYLAGSDPQNPLSTPLQIVAPPFQITSILQSNNNIVLTWNTAAGMTNQVQVTGAGSFSTNGFTDLGPQTIVGGNGIVTTNYTDVGGATNKPARYYRIRLVP